ncbi:hypothetical protein BDF22DRAFT_698620 [Syncephalis plumigaleata]|nr:hypothetical protein BDF22DRAFT_698620 [Syncephalis plumigaleata]
MRSHTTACTLCYSLVLFWLMASILSICFIAPIESRALSARQIPSSTAAANDGNDANDSGDGGDVSSSHAEQSTSVLVRRAGSGPDVGVVLTTCTIPDALALTFDDGPGRNTADILNALGRLSVKATFFVNGRNVGDLSRAEDAALLKRAYDEGHQIASHTFSHADLTQLSASGIEQQMTDLDNMIKGIIGVRVTYMRPPYGNTSPQVLSVLGSLGYHVVNWNLDTNDWQHPNDADATFHVYQSVMGNSGPGSSFISLQHDIQPSIDGQLVERVVTYARSLGKSLVRVDECLGAAGTAYRN